MKNLLCLLFSVFTFAAAGAETLFPAQPFRLYRTASGKPEKVQFYDAAGRSLFYGYYPANTLVTSPSGTAKVNAALTEITFEPVQPKVQPKKVVIPPDFWCETSKLRSNSGDRVELAPYGYAVGIPVPVNFGISWKRASKAETAGYAFPGAMPEILWYDADMNCLAVGGKKPENAAFFRVFLPYGSHNKELVLTPQSAYTPDAVLPPDHPGEIVLDPACDLRERFAATELARLVRIITGKRMAIVSAPTQNAAYHIFYGIAFARGNFPEDLKTLAGSEGFAIRQKDGDIYIFSASPRGAVYAAAQLIEDNSDFIHFRPDPRHGYSFTPVPELKFEHADVLSKPAFPERTWSGPGGNSYFDHHLWAAHNRVAFAYYCRRNVLSVENYRAKELGHYCGIGENFMSLPFLTDKKPEHYPMINGIRRIRDWGQPCFSNPEVVANTLRGVHIVLADPPEELDFFTYDYSDSWVCCECPECMKPIPLPDGKTLAAKSVVPQKDPHFRSTRTFMMGNLVAAEVDKVRPGTPTLMLAYIYTAANPAVKLNPLLKVIFASYDTSTMRFPLRDQTNPAYYAPESWAFRFKKWIAEDPASMGMYEYFFTASPGMFAEAAAQNMKDIAAAGGWRVHSQTQPDNDRKSYEAFGTNDIMWDINAMDQWMISRLMWNPAQDVAALRADFLRRVYRAGAPAMTEFYRLFARKWFDKNCKTFFNCHMGAGNAYTDFILKAGIEKGLFEAIAKAEKNTDSPAAKIHLQRKAAALKAMKASTGRQDIPQIDELAAEWDDPGSPHWNRALSIANFRLPDNPDWNNNFAKAKTEIRLGVDEKYLYFRAETDRVSAIRVMMDEDPEVNGDRIELRFRRGNKNVLFLLDESGAFSDMENWDYAWDSNWNVQIHPFKNGWGAVGRIPLQAVREKADSDIFYLFLRHTAEGELSFARSDTNRTLEFPTFGNNTFSILGAETNAEFDASLNPKNKDLPAKKYSVIADEKRFPVTPGKAYRVAFEAKTSRLFLPVDAYIVQEAAWQNPALFWRWEFEFTDAAGKIVKREGGRCRDVISTAFSPYTDYFFAPENAVAVRLRFLPPTGSHPAAFEYRKPAVSEYDLRGALNLNWDFSAGPVRSGWDSPMAGAGMRVYQGKTVFDSGYGVMTSAFPLEAGKPYVLTGKRTVYRGYAQCEVQFIDKNGKELKWASGGGRDADFRVKFIPPAGTVKGRIRIYSSLLESCRVEPDIVPVPDSKSGPAK